jgi:uncharacterized membrane protein YgcG
VSPVAGASSGATAATRLVLGWLLALAFALLAAPTAAATEYQGDRNFRRYDVDVQLARDGTARVTLDFDFDFADIPGHGPFVTLPLTQAIDGDEERVRSYPVSDVTAESPSGAPANVYLEERFRDDGGHWLEIRVGDEDIDNVSGVQRYVLRYTLRGMVNPGAGEGGRDEFFWNVIGTDWVTPLSTLSARVTGPADVADTICFAGPLGSTQSCTSHTFAGPTATFTHDRLEPGEPFTIDVAYPPGTFVGAEPIIIDKPTPPNPFAITPWTGGLAALTLVAGSALVLRRSGQHGRDEQYLGLTPGLTPAAGQEVAVGRARRAPVTVQFHPPAKVRPGEVGTLADEVADPHDVTATIVDLAVRGYLRIEEIDAPNRWGRGGDWRLRFVGGPAEGLAPFERELLDSLFADRLDPTLSGLRTTFAAAMGRVQDKLYQEVTEQGWFRGNPKSVRSTWVTGGILIAALGGGLTWLLATFTEWALIGVPVVLVGLLAAVLAKRAPARTAKGTAVLAQTLGFKRYLETAEGHQLRFEEGEDLFSRYLPFAIAFGVAERWAGIFERLAREGRAIAEPTWYVGPSYGHGHFWGGASHFSSTVGSFADVASTSIAAPTPGSSGRSGFGGGGSSGGGGGGGGGGGW